MSILLLSVTLFLSPVALLWAGAESSGEETWDARIVWISGDVNVRFEKGKPPAPAEKDMSLEAGHVVMTGKDGKVQISFDGETLLELGPMSRFVVHASKKKKTVVGLSIGTLLGKISSLWTESVFKVRTPTAVVAIRGTELAVEHNTRTTGDDCTMVGVFHEGRVSVSSDSVKGKEVVLGPNQETKVIKGQAPLPARKLRFLAYHKKRMKVLTKERRVIRKRWKKKIEKYQKGSRWRRFFRKKGLKGVKPSK